MLIYCCSHFWRRLLAIEVIIYMKMKIQKIVKIVKYKSFQDFAWQPFLNNEIFHDGVNILYGENGSGKSSICNLLKSVSGNKDFGKYEPTETCLLFDDGEKKYPVNNDWDNKIIKDSILFFDREFVDRNVHLGHKRDTTQNGQEQESGKMIIEFDGEAINLKNLRDEAKKVRGVEDQKGKDFNEANKDLLNFSLTAEEQVFFQKYKDKTEDEIKQSKQDIAKERKEVEKNLETDQGLQKKVSTIQSDIKNLSNVSVTLTMTSLETYQALFDFDLQEKAKIEAEQILIEKIKINKSFFDTGIEMRKTYHNQCPFCQSTTEEDGIKKMIDLYNQIYDTTYRTQVEQFGKDKKTLLDELLQLTQSLASFDLNSVFLELKRLDQNYKIPNIYAVDYEKTHKKPAVKAIEELHEKISKLVKPNKENIQELYVKAQAEFKALESFFKTLGDFVDQQNSLITKFKTDNTDEKLQSRIATNSKRIESINKELSIINGDKITNQKKKEEKQIILKALSVMAIGAKNKYDIALKKYEEYCSKEAFSGLLSKIQKYFENFNFSFKLELKTEPTGNKTEFPFAFRVLDFDGNERDFKEGLSEGEIQVLSLCFFFAFLDIQKDKDQKILVFDDPITSLDNSNLSCLVDLLAEEQKSFSQTLIFTHHRTFFKFLRKRFDIHCSEYNLIRNKKEFGGSFVCKSKAEKFLSKLRDFEADLAKIPSESLDVELKVVEYGQYLRYEVERYIKNTLLHWDADQNFTLAIDGVKTNKLISDDDLNKIKGIYSFCNWTTSHVDVGDENGLSQLKQKIQEFVAIHDKKYS